MILFAVEFSAEAIGVIGAQQAILVSGLVYVGKLLLAAHMREVELAKSSEREKTLTAFAKELTTNLELAAAKYAEQSGKTVPAALAAIVADHNSPETPEQTAKAALATIQARAVAAALVLELPTRPLGIPEGSSPAEPASVDTQKIMEKLEELPAAVVEAIETKSNNSPNVSPKRERMCGVLRSISNRTITITLDDGTEEPVEVSNGASVTRNGITIKLKDLQVGDKVEVDDNPATRVEALGAK